MNNDMQTIMVETAEKIFSDHCDKQLLETAEAGEFPAALWKVICENGFHLLAKPDSGAKLADVFAVLRVAGRHALPLPLAETLMAKRWLNSDSDSVASVGELYNDDIVSLAWGAQATAYVAVSQDNKVYLAKGGQELADKNIAFEPRLSLIKPQLQEIDSEDMAYELMALSRVAFSTGTLNRVLEMSIQYAGEREQFGRPIAKFQAIQHNLAVVASEVAAATRACDGAVESIGEARFGLEVAAAKSRIGEAVTIVAEAVHQLHGAMGFTHEHQLHHFTRRLWSWREEFGGEPYWQAKLGQHIHSLGANNAWDFIATAK